MYISSLPSPCKTKTASVLIIPDICHERHKYIGVNFFWPVSIFTDLTRKIVNLLCKLAIYCVNFGVNFIFQKLCLCNKNDKYQVCVIVGHFLMARTVLPSFVDQGPKLRVPVLAK